MSRSPLCRHQARDNPVQALKAVYADALVLSEDEVGVLGTLREAKSGNRTDAPSDVWAAAGDIAGTVELPGVQVEGDSVKVHFQLPPNYPEVEPRLRLICSAPRCALTASCTAIVAK